MTASSPTLPPAVQRVVETALYVDDLARAVDFYRRVLGLAPMFHDRRLAAFPVGSSVLLLFLRGSATTAVELPGGRIPPHDGAGPLHIALAIEPTSVDAWEHWLANLEVEIEGRTDWPSGSLSLYFRDPDQHLVELVTPGLWKNY
ncbi:VOC family protein [Halotalea alkalilenta]|uniref:Glyoxalase n=1 Tax=Halotalea alkalilenta TaxID=376489 RepID=A0A172YCA9_9GAMM|nr:VOC family protein [Halotalea alkalilenta]ANF56858.1 glyoxalase [Halotalea alkalilenta]